MFIKLNFSSNRRFGDLVMVLGEIINNDNINSVATLLSEFTANNYHPDWLTALDATNSEIWRTADSSNVRAHLHKSSTTAGVHRVIMEFSSYDDINQKYYTVFNGSTNTAYSIGNGISGSMGSTQFSLTGSTASTGGTFLGLVNDAAGFTALDTTPFASVRTLWVYLTNTAFVWATTNGTTFATGFQPNNSSYGFNTTYNGPFITSQYTRFDHHNNAGNGIIPVVFYNYRKVGGLYANDLISIQNTGFTTNSSSLPLMAYNFVDAYNQNGGFPIVQGPFVGITSGGLSTNTVNCRSDAKVSGSVSSFGAASYGGVYNPGASVRRPTSNLAGSGIGLITLGWEELFRGNHGGNISERGNFYVFNSEYAPGDDFVLDGKTWSIWPLHTGFSQRLGLAIPKE